MLGHLSLDIICSTKLTVFRERSFLRTANVRGPILEHILAPNKLLFIYSAQDVKRKTPYNSIRDKKEVKNDHRSIFSNVSNWKIYCDDHSSLSSTTAAQI